MEKVFTVRSQKREQIPAVTHVDGTGRLQSVSRSTNPLYWDLINTFAQRTGVPVVLNTSLNENEPIVRTPDELEFRLKHAIATRSRRIGMGIKN